MSCCLWQATCFTARVREKVCTKNYHASWSCREPLAVLRTKLLLAVVQVASPAAALGLFDLEEFSFGAPPASYRDSTPGLLMDQSLGAPSTLEDVQVRACAAQLVARHFKALPLASPNHLLTLHSCCGLSTCVAWCFWSSVNVLLTLRRSQSDQSDLDLVQSGGHDTRHHC